MRLIKAEEIESVEESVNKEVDQKIDSQQVDVVVDILKRVGNSANDIQSIYYSMLDNLNALEESYPDVYNEFKQLVKLPDKVDVENVVKMKEDILDALKYLEDPDFLKGIMK